MSSWNMGLLGAVAAPASAFELIQTVSLASNTTTVSFSSIPQTFTHLQVRAVMRTNDTSVQSGQDAYLRLNGQTSGYAQHHLAGDGSSVYSLAFTNQARVPLFTILPTNTSSFTGQNFGAAIIDILDYNSTSKNKTIRALAGMTRTASPGSNMITLTSGFLNSTSAVTSLEIFVSGISLVANTRISLYGIKG